MPQPSEREIEVFNTALELSAEERVSYLNRACAGDTALRLHVDELLQVSEEGNSIFDSPATGLQGSGGTIRFPNVPTAKAGDRIGRYKLLQQIGEGGCGIVYMAEQEEPVRRKVALKVIKLGMDTKEVIARFEAERQALALMDHPNIAKVLDAGATDTGRPYFVMELVRGIKITDYCDQNNLSTQERLDLFIQICRAIQHAHQKGIIHRDIKPSNILVTMNDGVPLPKVIDFGIAKATHGKLTDETFFTAFEQFIGTPAYMSPEQAEMSALDIDTRSDIYSLGVLLYELLTGQTPFDPKKLLQAGLDEIRRTIREQEPARPSTCLSTMLGADLTAIAKYRKVEPPGLIHLVRGDLDWIVMKCLEKDRTRRYDTANGLAFDLLRHLNSEPVLARPPSQIYRLQKLAQRNKLAVIAVAVVTATLVIGLGVSTWLFFKEQRALKQAEAQRRIAETESAKSKEVSRFLENIIQGVAPKVALGRDTTVLQEILAKTAEQVGTQFTNDPEIQVEICHTISRAYLTLGLWYKFRDMAQQEVDIARARLGEKSPLYVRGLAVLSTAQYELGNFTDAESTAREAVTIGRTVALGDSVVMADSMLVLANVQESANRESDETVKLLRQALEIYSHAPPGTNDWGMAIADQDLGSVLASLGRYAESEAVFSNGLSIIRERLGNDDMKLAGMLNSFAIALGQEGKTEQQEKLFREAWNICQKIEGPFHPLKAKILSNMAYALAGNGKLPEAKKLYGDEIERESKLLGPQHRSVVDYKAVYANVLRVTGQFAEADAVYREVIDAVRLRKPPEEDALTDALATLLVNMQYGRTFAQDEPYAREYVALRDKPGAHVLGWYLSRGQLGICLLGQKKYAEAEPLLLSSWEGLKPRAARSEKSQARANDIIQNLIELYGETSRSNELAKWNAEWVGLLEIEVNNFHTNTLASPKMEATALLDLSTELLDLEKFDESERLAHECLGFCGRKFTDQTEFFWAQCLVGRNLVRREQYVEAEPLLVSGCTGLEQNTIYRRMNRQTQQIFHDSLKDLMGLYVTTGRPDHVSAWQKMLAE